VNLRSFYRIAAVLIAVQLVVAVWGLARVGLTATVPIHWNAAGEPNGYGPAWLGFLVSPVISLGLVGLFALIPRIEPRRANLLRSSRAYLTVAVAALVLLTGVSIVTTLAALGYDVPISAVVGGGVGLLFIVLGNVLTTVRSNYMFGVRTPWTLTSDLAWDKTHRLMGRMWVIGGVLMFLASLLGSEALLLGVILLFVFGSLGVAFVYSYQVWKTDPNKRSMGGEA
jgi:uncharacterized membrane protein